MFSSNREFPCEINTDEKEILFSVLPEYKPGYRSYRDKIDSSFFIGKGRFGRGNFVLGKLNDKPDISVSSAPIFAAGGIKCKEGEIDIIIHEEQFEQIEIDVSAQQLESIPETITETSRWSYSDWQPGMKAPRDNSNVREVEIVKNKYVLVIASVHKKLWLYENETGVNHIIPLTNFFNELMGVKRIRDPKIALNPSAFFEHHEKYSDDDIINAFISYHKYMHKMNIRLEKPINRTSIKKKNLLSFLRRK